MLCLITCQSLVEGTALSVGPKLWQKFRNPWVTESVLTKSGVEPRSVSTQSLYFLSLQLLKLAQNEGWWRLLGTTPDLGGTSGLGVICQEKEWIVNLWVPRTLERKPADGIRRCLEQGFQWSHFFPMGDYTLPQQHVRVRECSHTCHVQSVHIYVNIHTHIQGVYFCPCKISFLAPSPAHSHGCLSETEPCSVLGCLQVRTLPPGSRESIFKPPLPGGSCLMIWGNFGQVK